MTITAYQCGDDAREVNKTLSAGQQFTDVRPIEPIDIMSPRFLMNYRAELLNYNYMHAFGRYYFMRATVEPAGAMRLICTEDVLYTHKAGILGAPCVCERSTAKYNGQINDPRYPTRQKKAVEVKKLFGMSNADAIVMAYIE